MDSERMKVHPSIVIKSVADVVAHFANIGHSSSKTPFSCSRLKQVVPITSGSTNFTFRLHLQEPMTLENHQYSSVILKSTPPFVASTPHIPFDSYRSKYEAKALLEITAYLRVNPRLDQVKIPTLLYHDVDNAIIIMEDFSPPSRETSTGESSKRVYCTLLDFCKGDLFSESDSCLAAQSGSLLGQFLATLHSAKAQIGSEKHRGAFTDRTALQQYFSGNTAARVVCAQTAFGDVLPNLDEFGVSLADHERVVLQKVIDETTKDILHAKTTMLMGDLWAGNVHLTLDKTDNNCLELRNIHVFDWEFATCGPEFVDLAHIASEAWLQNHFCPPKTEAATLSQKFSTALFQSYREEGGLIDVQKITYYIAGHICCFLGYAPWTNDPEKRRTTAIAAVNMILRAFSKDWAALEQDEFLKALFT